MAWRMIGSACWPRRINLARLERLICNLQSVMRVRGCCLVQFAVMLGDSIILGALGDDDP